MNLALQRSLDALFGQLRDTQHPGRAADAQEMYALNREAGGIIPDWYIEMATTYPLCGLDFEWRAFPPEDGCDGIVTLGWSSPRNMRIEMIEAYPGTAILPRGCINVAYDETGGGDPYFIPTDRGDDPPLFQVYHDFSDDPEEILRGGTVMIAEKLSDFFGTVEVRLPEK